MKTKHLAPLLILFITLFSSCVGEDVVFVEELSSNVNFDKRLLSVAEDETTTVNLVFRNDKNEIITDLSDLNIEFSSDDPNILTIDKQGVITPISNGETSIRVNVSTDDFVFPEIEDEIIIGKVTITESDAQLLTENEITRLVNEGYIPEITITNPISEIDIEDTMQFTAAYKNIKNQSEEVDFLWESSDTAIIEISNSGLATPKAKGDADITVSFTNSDNIIASMSIPVTVSEETIVVTPDPMPEPIDEREVLGFGEFRSGDNASYDSSGDFQIIRENGVTNLNLAENFTFNESGGSIPDLVIYLSNSTRSNNGASEISEDIDFTGAQSFVIPDTINPDNYDFVLLYCRRFGVFVGYAPITR